MKVRLEPITDPVNMAFPCEFFGHQGGLTKREYMATMIMAQLAGGFKSSPSGNYPLLLGENACRWTDGLIKSLNGVKIDEEEH